MKYTPTLLTILLLALLSACATSKISVNPSKKKPGSSPVDVLYFYDDHCSKATSWVRQAAAEVKSEIGQYVEAKSVTSPLAKELAVVTAPVVIVVKHEVEVVRFTPISKSQVVSLVRQQVYR